MLVEAENRERLAGILRTLKSVSAKEVILQAEACRGKRSFWARRYGCKEVSQTDVPEVKRYIKEQKNTPHFRVGNMDLKK